MSVAQVRSARRAHQAPLSATKAQAAPSRRRNIDQGPEARKGSKKMTHYDEVWDDYFAKLKEVQTRTLRILALTKNFAGEAGDRFYMPTLQAELGGVLGTLHQLQNVSSDLRAWPEHFNDTPPTAA